MSKFFVVIDVESIFGAALADARGTKAAPAGWFSSGDIKHPYMVCTDFQQATGGPFVSAVRPTGSAEGPQTVWLHASDVLLVYEFPGSVAQRKLPMGFSSE